MIFQFIFHLFKMEFKNVLVSFSSTKGHALSEPDDVVWVAASVAVCRASHASVLHAEEARTLALGVGVAHVVAETVGPGLREGLVHRPVRGRAHRELLAVERADHRALSRRRKLGLLELVALVADDASLGLVGVLAPVDETAPGAEMTDFEVDTQVVSLASKLTKLTHYLV